jgi:hypothetical protein
MASKKYLKTCGFAPFPPNDSIISFKMIDRIKQIIRHFRSMIHFFFSLDFVNNQNDVQFPEVFMQTFHSTI